ncbi:HARB1 nuclease, partial [Polyodon spathula]|nr:HARB1 nuclease [Polyodon spathula]
MQQFCLKRQTITDICQLLQADLEGDMWRARCLPVVVRVPAALTFYATGSFQHTVGYCKGINICNQNIWQITPIKPILIQKCCLPVAIYEVCIVSGMKENSSISQGFLGRYGFPGVLGAINCTHVQLCAPTEDRHLYINHKGPILSTCKKCVMPKTTSQMCMQTILVPLIVYPCL